MAPSAEELVLRRAWREPGGCWLWIAALSSGYGVIRLGGRNIMAHRLSYETFVGPIPDWADLDHLCRERACVNPQHLEPVTRGENVRRGIGPSATNARKTHCLRGHPFDVRNTRVTKQGKRHCRTCFRDRMRLKRSTGDPAAAKAPKSGAIC